jgi:hypothetical protein
MGSPRQRPAPIQHGVQAADIGAQPPVPTHTTDISQSQTDISQSTTDISQSKTGVRRGAQPPEPTATEPSL